MKCNCEKNCIISKEEVLADMDSHYIPCPECDMRTLKKAIPIKNQLKLDEIDSDYKRCKRCNKRNIDIVMAHILKILVDEGILGDTSSIRKIGTPLITPAIAFKQLPYLSENNLVFLSPFVNEDVADKIYKQVPEVKAVIKGDIKDIVGQLDSNHEINNYELLAGCDVRCDIQHTAYGEICLYKQQSKIHIESPKFESPKIIQLDEVLSRYDNPSVIDAMCGPGTLGIYSLLKNAKKVIFNDIYVEAIDTLKTNLEINEINPDSYEIYNLDIKDLSQQINEKYDVGLIDAFPNIAVDEYKSILEKICKEVVII